MMKHGVVIGKFMPITRGHMHLIEEAHKQCEKVTVLVCSLKREPIPGELRHYWVAQIFPDLNVVHVTDEVPQYPHEDANFWDIWVNLIKKNTTPDLDCIFSSETYGKELATRLGINEVLVDLDRKTVPISATLVRSNPYKYWDYIPDIVKPYYIKKVVLTGPESVGKTTTSHILAQYYNTVWVPEYGREYCEKFFTDDSVKQNITLKDISLIAAGQLYDEQVGAIRAGQKSKLVIYDTDLIVTQIWSEIFFKSCPEWIVNTNRLNRYDLYLLLKPDIPWVQDGQREFSHLREYHFNRIKKELDERKLNYIIISGDNYKERTEQCISAIDKMMANTFGEK